MPNKKLLHSHHPVRHAKSFKYAFKGIFHALINEANFRVQVVYTACVVIAGFYFDISTSEWSVLVLSTGFLLSAEMVNTVVEEFIDHLIKDHNDGARIIKDLSAGFVLTAAISSLIICGLIFGSRIIGLYTL